TFGARYRAALRSADPSADKPRVMLEDIALGTCADGQCSGVASFDMQPAGATSCQFNLPAEYKLLGVTLDGVAVEWTDLGENRFNVLLGENKLPRHLEAVFAGRLLNPDGMQVLNAPSVSGMPAEQTTWAIATPK